MSNSDDLARAASDAVDAWCAANPAPAWPVLAAGQTMAERVAAIVKAAGFGPVPERVEATYTPHTSPELAPKASADVVADERMPSGIGALVSRSPDGDSVGWLTIEELRADPIMCEECGTALAEFHGVDGWMCGECAEEADPRYEG